MNSFRKLCLARQSGVSLVELMIAMVISLILLGGVVQIMSGTRASYLTQEGTSRLQQNARFAVDRMIQDLGAAGYMGCMDSGNGNVPVFNDLTNQAFGGTYDFGNAIFGTNNTGPNNSDTISIRRGSADGGIRLTAAMANPSAPLQLNAGDAAYASLQQFDTLVVGDCGNASVFMITNNPTGSGGTIAHAAGTTATTGPNIGQSNASGSLGHVYGAQTSSAGMAFRVGTTTYMLCPSIANGARTSLFNVNNCGNATAANEIVEGVQDMQITYGLNTNVTLGADMYLRADQIGATQWNSVVSARIALTFDTVDPVPGSATPLTKNFTTTVRLRNRGES
jgi:type IV pilus assembly protein PilW